MALKNVVELSVRDVPVGGVTRARPVPAAVLGRASLTLLIHGFNNSQPDAQDSYRRFLRNSRLAESTLAGQVCVVFWPGDHGVFRYYQEIARAKECAAMLLHDLLEIRGEGELEVSLICHSLGNRLALELIAEAQRTGATRIRFVRAAMMAAAVPTHFVGTGGLLQAAATAIATREVFHSASDEALGVAFTGGQLLAGEPSTAAVGKSGDPPGTWTLVSDFTPYGHGDYWPEPESALSIRATFGLSTTRYIPRRSRVQRWLAPLSRLPRREMGARTLFPYLDDD